MTFGVSSFGDSSYDRRYYHVHHADSDGNFTVEGDPYIHEPYRVLRGGPVNSEAPKLRESDYQISICEIEDEAEFFTDNLSRFNSQPDIDEYSPAYLTGLAIASIVFICLFVVFLACTGLGVHVIMQVLS